MASSGRTLPNDAPGTATRDPITAAQLSIVPRTGPHLTLIPSVFK